MSSPLSESPPRFVYDRRYVEPDLQLLVVEELSCASGPLLPCTTRMNRYKPTGTRTSAGFYEYELVEELTLL